MRCPRCDVTLSRPDAWMALPWSQQDAMQSAHDRTAHPLSQRERRYCTAGAYRGGWVRVGLIWQPTVRRAA